MPTGEVLANGQRSASVYRRGTNGIQRYTNVADFAGTFAYGFEDCAEIFGSFLVDAPIDRNIRPMFVNDPSFGGHRSLSAGGPVLDRRQHRRGMGVAFRSRNVLRISGELNGYIPSKDPATITGLSIVGVDLSRAPLTWSTENISRATLGLTFQAKNGFFADGGVGWNVPTRARSGLCTDETDVLGDYYDMQFRIGYHPGVRVYVPPPPPQPAPPAQPPAHTLTVKAACDPCTVETGGVSVVTTGRGLRTGGRRADIFSAPSLSPEPFLLYDPPLWRSGLPLPNKSTR